MVYIFSKCAAFGGLLHIAFILGTGFLIPAHAHEDSRDRLVRVTDIEQITDPVLISSISVGTNNIQCGLFVKPPAVIQPVTAFKAGNEWLKNMTISLVNRTDKPIMFGGINLLFVDTGDCRSLPCVGAYLTFGQRPAIDSYNGRTGKPFKAEPYEIKPIDWKPNETFILRVSDYMDMIENKLSAVLPASQVSSVNVYRGEFFLNDGTRWTLGKFSVPDSDHPGKFKDLPANYFPGKRGYNWPPGYNN